MKPIPYPLNAMTPITTVVRVVAPVSLVSPDATDSMNEAAATAVPNQSTHGELAVGQSCQAGGGIQEDPADALNPLWSERPQGQRREWDSNP